MGRWILLAFAVGAGCAPDPGEEGYEACEPEVVDRDCAVWRCYHVYRDRQIELWYEVDNGAVMFPCEDDDRCTEAREDAILQGCEVVTPEAGA